MSDTPRPTAYTIRMATPADAGAVCDLIHELAEYERLQHLCRMTPERLLAAAFGRDRACEVLVAEVSGRVEAMALFFHNFSTFAAAKGIYLEDLYVRPQFRRMGIGTALLAELAAIAIERQCERLEWAVLEWNELALNRYRALGGQVLSDWRLMRLDGEALKRLADNG